MKKHLGVGVLVGAIGFAIACSSTQEGSAQDAGPGDASTTAPDTGVVVKKDSGTSDSGGSCYDGAAAQGYIWEKALTAHKGVCTAAQIAKVISECTNGTEAQCDAYMATADYSKDCDRCINGSGKDDTQKEMAPLDVPVVLTISLAGDFYSILNYDACAAVALGIGAACANPVTQVTGCQYSTCEACSDPESDACLAEAAAGACKADIDAIKTSCYDKIDAGEATWSPLCTGGKTAFDDVLPVMANYICGKAP